MDYFIESINRQIESNREKNIFSDHTGIFQFVDETIQSISRVEELSQDLEIFLVDYTVEKVIDTFYQANQYYSFDSNAKRALRQLYLELFEELRQKSFPVDTISSNHYKKLREWIMRSDPFAEKIFRSSGEMTRPVACSEYSPELQIKILQLDISRIMQPLLDVGCGSQGSLVRYLKAQGIEAYGLDRLVSGPHAIKTGWLEYEYGVGKWGTVVSNLGFSNHFNHHHLRLDGNYIEYAHTYMCILNALKTGGCFHYAPDLPFIEEYLDGERFAVTKTGLAGYDFKSSVIQKLK